MDSKLEQSLVQDYPSFFRHHHGDPRITCMAFGMDCGDGWFPILQKVCQQIKELGEIDFYFTQIKEKWGLLRVYYSCTMKHNMFYKVDKVDKIVDAAEVESSKTCEKCGSTTKVTTKSVPFWISTLCLECEKALPNNKSNESVENQDQSTKNKH